MSPTSALCNVFANTHTVGVVSIVCCAVSLLLTAYTAYVAHKSKTAADAAKTAVDSYRLRFSSLDAMSAFDSAIAQLTHIQALHRDSAWKQVSYQHSLFKRTLVALKGCKPELDANQRTALQRGVNNLTQMQGLVENELYGEGDGDGDGDLNGAMMNTMLSDLETALAEMRTDIHNRLQVL